MADDKSVVLEKAHRHIQKGQWQKAAELMEEAHLMDRSDPLVTLRLGDLYKKLGRVGDAAIYYRGTADIFAETGQTTKAAATYKMALRLDPRLGGVHEKLERLTSVREGQRGQGEPAPPSAGQSPPGGAPCPGPGLRATGPEDGRPMEVYYGAVERDEAPGGPDVVHETIPGLVELGSTVGRLVPVSEQGDGSRGEDSGGIELSSGVGDAKIESFAMNKEAGRLEPAFAADGGLAGSGPSSPGLDARAAENSPPPDPSDIFSGFASDVQAPPEGAGSAGGAPPGAVQPGREIEFLTDLDEDELWDLLGRMDRLTFGPDEPIIREGETGDSIYIITSGRVLVTTTNDGMRVRLAELEVNDFFGEVSFLTGKRRTADVTAVETTTVMVFSRFEMDELIKKYPGVERVLRMFQKERVADTIAALKTLSEGIL